MPWLLSPYFFYGYSICLNSQNCPTLLMKRSKIVHQRFCVYHLGEKYLVSTCVYEVILCLGQPCECRQIQNQLDLLDWTTSAAEWYRNLITLSLRAKNQLLYSTNISDFRQNSTTKLSLLRDFKSAKLFAISLFVAQMLGKYWF